MYEQRAILFLDILGFKKLIQEKREDLLIDVLGVPKGLEDRYPFDGRTNMEISAFSDSIVVSEIVKDDHIGMVRLAGYASYLWWKFLAKGVLTRGGIAVGGLHHKNGILFGPAMNEAYELESQLAIYPRIVVSEEAQQLLYSEAAKEHKECLPMMFLQMSLVRRDFDGIGHVHVLGSAGSTPNECLPKKDINPRTGGTSFDSQELNQGKWEMVERLLQDRPTERRVASKYDWLRNYLSETKQAAV